MLSVYRNIFKHYFIRRTWFLLKERLAPERYSDTAFFSLFSGAPAEPEAFLDSFVRRTQYNFFFSAANRKDFFLQLLMRLHPQQELVMQAEKIMRGKIALLGTEHQFEQEWNWHLDWKSGYTFDAASFYANISLKNDGADIKLPWELSRASFIWTLGKAYWTTNRTSYKDKFMELIEDWQKKNPFCYGINWLNAMEVALRAANWIAGFYFFCDDKNHTRFWIDYLKALFQHGIYIEHNLEYTRRSGNHLIADAVGLLMLGFFFRQSARAQTWITIAKKILEEEILAQTYDDGMDYEMSLPYHAFVSEMLLAAFILARLNKTPFSEAFKARLEKMFEVMLYCLKPDGTLPLIGDSDDGKLFWFNAESDYNSQRDRLVTASIVFQRSDFKAAATDFSEHALWHLGIEGWENFQRMTSDTAPLTSKLLPKSQFAVLRSENMHIVIDAGELGKHGWGGHGHNDTFSFELCCNGVTFITDSGTYCYTSDKARRNQFRSTRAHNTIMIDGIELAEFVSPFKVRRDRTNPKILKWQSSHECDDLLVEHSAYTFLAEPITHRRNYRLNKTKETFQISDMLLGKGQHRAELYLHFAPDIQVSKQNREQFMLQHLESGTQLVLRIDNVEHVYLEDSEIAPRYGVLQQSKRLRAEKIFSNEAQIQLTISTELERKSL